jgi:anthranilate/para-aminobenzoate synthase component II
VRAPDSAGRPEDSGIALQIIAELGTELPIFGVCMGHQCIGQVLLLSCRVSRYCSCIIS